MATTILLEPPTECPTEHLPFARDFISRCNFVYAKTVPQAPHEYCPIAALRADAHADADRFFALIAEHGYRGRFSFGDGRGTTYTYLNVPAEDGESWRYWRSDAFFPPAPGGMINRASNSRAPVLLPGAEVAHIDKDSMWATSDQREANPQGQLWRPDHD